MAEFHNDISHAVNDIEKDVRRSLDRFLDDDYHIWTNLNYFNEVDFFIVNPSIGIVLIEVKGWTIYNLDSVSNHDVTGKLYKGKHTTEENPLNKITKLAAQIKKDLEKKSVLLQKTGKHKGKLEVPVNGIVLFPNISTDELGSRGFCGPTKLDTSRIITSDEYEHNRTPEDFQEMLQAKRKIVFNGWLSEKQLEFIISNIGTSAGVKNPASGELEGVLDAHQETIASMNIEKDIIIEGPAGSGKTIVLIKRLQNLLKRFPDKEFGVLCYNVVLNNYLKTYINSEIGECSNVHIHNLDDAALSRKTFDILLVDEAQDIQVVHLDTLPRLLMPEGVINLFYDKRQTLFSEQDLVEKCEEIFGRSISEKDLLLQKRSSILRLAVAFYESVKSQNSSMSEIIALADKITFRMFFSKKHFKAALRHLSKMLGRFLSSDKDARVQMKLNLRNSVVLKYEPDIEISIRQVVSKIKELVQNGNDYRDFMILHPLFRDVNNIKNFRELIAHELKTNGIPFEIQDKEKGLLFDGKNEVDKGDNKKTLDFLANTVKVFEIFHCKGLDANHVFVFDFDKIGKYSNEGKLYLYKDKEAQYGYVAITRAKKTLTILSRTKVHSFKRLQSLLQEMA